METLIKIGGLLAVLVVPIFLAHLNNRLAHLKHSKDSKAEALKLADEFESSELEKRSTLYKDRLAKSLFGYIAFAFVGLIPFYKAQKYMDWILSFYDKGMLLSIFIIVALHTICLVAAFLCLKYVERCVDASIFINDFNKYAFKVHVIEEKENKDVDIVA